MASNPIQRRARQSFLVGFLIALIIMAVVVVILFMKISTLNEENKSLQTFQTASTVSVYVLNDDVKSGETLTLDMFSLKTVVMEVDVSGYLTASDFYDDDDNEIERVALANLTAGSPVLYDVTSKSDNVLTDDERIMEYNMIVLPSELQNGDYIDIRISLPDGSNYIVLSKKYVEQTTATTVWIKVTEEEILMLNSAIVEAYQVTGSRLYAIQYTEPGLQEAAIETYRPSESVIQLMDKDDNIVDTAWNALANKIYGNYEDYASYRSIINTYKSDMNTDDLASAVESGNEEENEAVSAARDEFVTALDGTGLVGSQNY